MKFIDYVLNTNGQGYWSGVSKPVQLTRMDLHLPDRRYGPRLWGELRVYFSHSSWDVSKDGLIYTDPLWLEDFRSELMLNGYSRNAVMDVDYSEQGMQGTDYVSMDVSDAFIREYFGEDFGRLYASIPHMVDA